MRCLIRFTRVLTCCNGPVTCEANRHWVAPGTASRLFSLLSSERALGRSIKGIPKLLFGQVFWGRPGVSRQTKHVFLKNEKCFGLATFGGEAKHHSFSEHVWFLGLGTPGLGKTTWPTNHFGIPLSSKKPCAKYWFLGFLARAPGGRQEPRGRPPPRPSVGVVGTPGSPQVPPPRTKPKKR